MASLADLPELVGFFSYSRQDDQHSQGALSALRTRIHSELRLQLGRDVRVWQDTAAIPEGALWEDEIKRAIAESVFFIPIVTPSTVGSRHCRFEFGSFLEREAALGRSNLIFPLLYIRVPALENEAQWRQDDVLKIIGARQYIDWHRLRHRGLGDPDIAEKIEQYCGNIVEGLRRPWIAPEERRILEAERQREAAAAAQRAEEVRQKAADEADRRREAQLREDDEKRRRAEAERLAAVAARQEQLDREAGERAAAAAAKAQRRPQGAAPAFAFGAMPAAGSLLDVASWSYLKIGIVAAVLGVIAALTYRLELHGLIYGSTYLLDSEVAIYSAALLFFVTRLTRTPAIAKLVGLFAALYVIEIVMMMLQGEEWSDARVIAASTPIVLVEWLFVAVSFLTFKDAIKDVVVLALALVAGFSQGILSVAADRYSTFPGNAEIEQAFALASGVLCLTFAIRRYRRRHSLP
jgi:TIR domain